MAGLHALGLLQDTRYITAISGGSWAIGAYMYQQLTVNDTIFLGPVTPPEQITMEGLNSVDPKGGRTKFAEKSLNKEIAWAFFFGKSKTWSYANAWIEGLTNVLLEPLGIDGEKIPVFDAEAANDYVQRYPDLYKNEDFIYPRKTPFRLLHYTTIITI